MAAEHTGDLPRYIPRYVEEAVGTFKELMANREKNMLEEMNRANKGELFVLHHLSRRDSEIIPSELSLALHSSPARISALLGSLEKKGQIERNIDKNNRRNILVTITEAGRLRADRDRKIMDDKLANVFIEMGERDTAEYLRLWDTFFSLMHTFIEADTIHKGEDVNV